MGPLREHLRFFPPDRQTWQMDPEPDDHTTASDHDLVLPLAVEDCSGADDADGSDTAGAPHAVRLGDQVSALETVTNIPAEPAALRSITAPGQSPPRIEQAATLGDTASCSADNGACALDDIPRRVRPWGGDGVMVPLRP